MIGPHVRPNVSRCGGIAGLLASLAGGGKAVAPSAASVGATGGSDLGWERVTSGRMYHDRRTVPTYSARNVAASASL